MEQNRNPKYCVYCGAPLQGEGKFCMQCGKPAPAAPPQEAWQKDATQKWNPEMTQQWDMDATQQWNAGAVDHAEEQPAGSWIMEQTQQIWEGIPDEPVPQPEKQWEEPEESEEPEEPVAWNTTVAKTTIAEQKAAGKPPVDKKRIALIASICSLVLALGLLVGIILLKSCDKDTGNRDDEAYSGGWIDETDGTDETDETEQTQQSQSAEESQTPETNPPTAQTAPPVDLEELVNERELKLRTDGAVWHLCIAEEGELSKIQWTTSDPAVATVDETGTVTAMGKGTATITATYEDQKVECTVTVAGGMTYAEFMAAEFDSAVTVDGYVQAVTAWNEENSNADIYAQTQEGGFYVFRLFCTQEDYARLTAGRKIRVTGTKALFAGWVEVIDSTAEILEEAPIWIAEPLDVTALLGTETLQDHMNKKVSFTDVTIAPINDAEGNERSFLYGYDSFGNREENCDLYLNVSINGEIYMFCVESDLCGNTSQVYAAVEALQVGDQVDITGFLCWYEGPQPHITAITVK